jgi:hypothetical protein
MNRVRALVILALVLTAGALFATLAWAGNAGDQEIAAGTRVAGIDVGGLTQDQAMEKVWGRLRTQVERPVRVRVGDRTFVLSTRRANLRLGLKAAVAEAYEAGRGGNVLQRGWRNITGGKVDHDEPPQVTFDRGAVKSFISRIHRNVSRRPVDAALELSVAEVQVTKAKSGRRLADHDGLARKIYRSLSEPSAKRKLRARLSTIEPKVTTEQLWEKNPVVVTVSRAGKTVRIFKRGELSKSYNVAVGQPEYPTPTGQYVIQNKQLNPTWSVPNSDWAGSLAGQTIGPDDPRNPLEAAFIAFNGAVGFHGTASISSLGTAASHGCIRMAPADVLDLYERVDVGTPVLVAD